MEQATAIASNDEVPTGALSTNVSEMCVMRAQRTNELLPEQECQNGTCANADTSG